MPDISSVFKLTIPNYLTHKKKESFVGLVQQSDVNMMCFIVIGCHM